MKATKAEIAQRVEQVLGIRLDGAEFHDIVQNAAKKKWGVAERQLWNYLYASDKLLAARREKDRDKLLARHVAQRRTLYTRAVKAADYRTALAIVKDEAELQGLYPPHKMAPTNPEGTKPYQGTVTHDLAGDLLPYADAIRTFIGGGVTLPPTNPSQPVAPPPSSP